MSFPTFLERSALLRRFFEHGLLFPPGDFFLHLICIRRQHPRGMVQVVELLQRQPEIPPSKGYTPSVFHGEIEMKDIVFSYPSRPHQTVLNGFNLQVRAGGWRPRFGSLSGEMHPDYQCESLVCAAGEVIAFVGPSGGGKSSIV